MFKPKKKEQYSFAGLIKGMQQAVSSAHEIMETQQLMAINKYFDQNGNALTKTLYSPAGEEIQVPLIALIPQGCLMLNEVELRFQATIEDASGETLSSGPLTDEIDHIGLDLSVTSVGGSDIMEVTMRFQSQKPTEGLNKLVDEYIKFL